MISNKQTCCMWLEFEKITKYCTTTVSVYCMAIGSLLAIKQISQLKDSVLCLGLNNDFNHYFCLRHESGVKIKKIFSLKKYFNIMFEKKKTVKLYISFITAHVCSTWMWLWFSALEILRNWCIIYSVLLYLHGDCGSLSKYCSESCVMTCCRRDASSALRCLAGEGRLGADASESWSFC